MPVTRLEITSQKPFADGQSFGESGSYTQIDGTALFAVDPLHPANETIADIKLAPRNAGGLVEFSADFRILRPEDPGKGNGRLLLDVLNRGKALALRNINSAPDVAPDAPLHPGNGFLMRQGYTLVWCGWQHDVPDMPGLLRIHVPEAIEDGKAVSGRIVVTFQPNAVVESQYLSDRMHRAYPANKLEDWESVMTVQEDEDAREQVIPRKQWWFARLEDGRLIPDPCYVHLEGGFQPGKVYQVIYTTTGAPIAGLGLAATRDIASHLRFDADSHLEHAYAFGVSQSGRFLRSFLYHGLNYDESGRAVFDGFMPHVAGGKRGEFNQRFAQPSSQATRSVNSLFPFADAAQTDPDTGLTDGLLSRLAHICTRDGGELPKVMYTYTSSEYWAGHGALVHTDVEGQQDVEPPDAVRVYAFAGTQHALGGLPLTDTDPVDGYRGAHPFNCLDYRALLRTALVNLDRWVSSGEPAPPSQYPRIADGTAVAPATAAKGLEVAPGVKLPKPVRKFTRLDFGPDPLVPTVVPATVGRDYPCFVSQVDADGNELAGIRLPLVSVPLATHLGWNRRHADIGGEGQTLSTGGASGGTLRGSSIPFAATRDEREETGDPRLSIEERYASRQDFLEKIENAARGLVADGYLLEEDVEPLVAQAREQYEVMAGRVQEVQPVGD
ncbi:MAG: hypothetical protein F4X66_21030 [Chloroflexi bacterium]|nr:hypothetical protein [Chloroflexota bacterium]MYE41955.1 hypothetical protein [Chloroflexota bacterium]